MKALLRFLFGWQCWFCGDVVLGRHFDCPALYHEDGKPRRGVVPR